MKCTAGGTRPVPSSLSLSTVYCKICEKMAHVVREAATVVWLRKSSRTFAIIVGTKIICKISLGTGSVSEEAYTCMLRATKPLDIAFSVYIGGFIDMYLCFFFPFCFSIARGDTFFESARILIKLRMRERDKLSTAACEKRALFSRVYVLR